jgi:hypothetical protein
LKLDFTPAETFRGTRILRQANNLAFAYVASFKAVDADGAPSAYDPSDTGLDALANAGYPHTNWWKDVLVPDPANPSKPFVQPSGEFEGYFVSMTSLRDPNGVHTDPATYVDATRFPYVVIPTGFGGLPHVGKPGDVGFATHVPTGITSTFILGDSGGGSSAKLGEASIAFWVSLGGQSPNPRNGRGAPSGAVQYIIFPGSAKSGAALWPRTNQDIHDQAMQLVSNTPGIAA